MTDSSTPPAAVEPRGGSAARRRAPWYLLVPAGAAALVVLAPIWYLADRAVERGWDGVVDELWQARTRDLVVRSLVLACTVTALCVVIGVAAAWLVTRTDLPGRRVLSILLALPLAVPSYLSAFAWVSWRPGLAGFTGAVLVLTCVSYPFVYLPCLAALGHLDPAHEEVARSLGRTIRGVVLGLTLRQIRPAITAGGLLVMLYVLSDFGAVAAMRYEVFTWVIYGSYRAGFNPSRAAILASVLVMVALVLVVLETRARGRASSARLGAGTARRGAPLRLGRTTPVAYVFIGGVLVVAIVVPLVRIVQWVISFESNSVDLGDVRTALGSTLRLAALAAAVTTAAAVPVGYLAARYRSRTTQVVEGATYVTHALPGIVLAISMVYIGVRVLRDWYQQTPLLILGYVLVFLPLAVGSVRTSIEHTPIRAEEVARALGSRPLGVTLRVTLPLALPGLAAGAAMVFLSAMKELPVTLILRPTGTETLATRLWNYTTVSDFGNAGPYALALVLFAAVPTAILSVVATRRSEARR